MHLQPVLNLLQAGVPLLGGGGLPTLFTWNPGADGPGTLPVGAIFTRASDAQEFTGSLYVLRGSNVIRDQVALPGGTPGYLGEPATTNQVQTNDLTDAGWTQDSVTLNSDGVGGVGLNQYTIIPTVGDVRHRIFRTVTAGATGSAYAIYKAAAGLQFALVARGGGSDDYAAFDLLGGSVTEEGAGISSAFINSLGNDNYKCVVITADTSTLFSMPMSDTGTPGTSIPTFAGAGEELLISHAQYTFDNFDTSPIVTSGFAASRDAEVLDSGVVIPTEFGALFDVTAPNIVGTGNTISLLGAATSVVDILRLDASFNVIMDDGGTPTTIGTVSAGQRFRVSYGRDATGRSGSLDGAASVTGDAPAAGHEGENFELYSTAGANQARSIGHESNIYSVRPSDAELQQLSS